MKTNSLKKLTSVLLIIVMCFSLLPMTTLATGGDTGVVSVFSENLNSEPITYIAADETASVSIVSNIGEIVVSEPMDEENEMDEASEEGVFSSLAMSTSQKDPTKILTLEPKFSSDVTEYDITVPDTDSSVWVKAVNSNPDHKMMYTNYPHAAGSETYSFRSGNWTSMSTGINSKDNRNTLHLHVGPYSIMDSPDRWRQDNTLYTFTFWRQLSLKSLKVAEAATDLDKIFNEDTLNYTVGVPADTETINITPTSSSNTFTYDLEVNDISVESGKTVEFTPDWDEQGKSQVAVNVGYTVNDTVGNYDINAVPTTYTITLVKEGLSDEPLMLTQPKSAVYLDTATEVEPLIVKATANGELFYQWYSNTENSSTGGTMHR